MEYIIPSVLIDGQTVYPEGWMWVLAFALRGVPWAVEEANKLEFRETVKNYLREKKIKDIEKMIKYYEDEINECRIRLIEI